ncbi:MAG: ATP-binding protein [Solirubrobacteraceae bacterium]
MINPPETIGGLFPLGGPVPRDLIIGRRGDIDELTRRMREGMSTMLAAPRRIGKTTVCAAVCADLKEQGALVVEIDVPERPDSRTLLQPIIDACSRISLTERGRRAFRAAQPLIQKLLADQGIPLDLSLLAGTSELPARAVLSLPLELAKHRGKQAVVFFDELQRVVDYTDGNDILRDLVDIYGASEHAVVLVDGSDERALEGMLGAPAHFGKLVDRLGLDPKIPFTSWRAPLTDRFTRLGLELPAAPLESILQWSAGHPYRTMAACRYTAHTARKTNSTTVGDFDVQMGIDEAERYLRDDAA